MSIKGRRKSESFWQDNLTCYRWSKLSQVPPHIPKHRLSYWDSGLEYTCYNKLCNIFPARKIERQKKIEILPEDLPFRKLDWHIDFFINDEYEPWYIECKGKWLVKDGEALGNFTKLLRYLKSNQPEVFERLVIVSDSSFNLGLTKIKVISFKEMFCKFA